MSHDLGRKPAAYRDFRDRDRRDLRDNRREPRDWDRDRSRRDYRDNRSRLPRKRSRSISRSDAEKRRSRSPRKSEKELDDNILSEISKLPEPSELWDSQFQEGGFPAPQPIPPNAPPTFQEPGSYPPSYQQSYPGVYDDIQHPPEMAAWNQMSLPPPPVPQQPFPNVEDQIKKEAAIESEMRHQKAALSKQREDYIKKAAILKKELDTLKDQRNELRDDTKRSPSPDTKRFLKQNTKLQLEIQNKLKTITNVVDMLNGIIGEEAQEILPDTDDSPDRKRKSRSPTKFNYVYYDPEMHWCRVCNEFPPTAKDYLNHLHSAAHHKMAAAHMEAPWHTVAGVNEGFVSNPTAPTKRTPIRGLQFFVPSTAWYCKLCDQFIGDLHCASAHLKSVVHSKNYTNFVEQNPHWETDWMSDRQKAFEKVRANIAKAKPQEDKTQYTAHTITFSKDGFHTKRNKSPTPPTEEKEKKKKKDKKKKKRKSSSSSSDSSSSSESEREKKSKSKTLKLKSIMNDEKALQEWMKNMQADRLSESDRKLLDTIKQRIKKEDKHRSVSRDRERKKDDRERNSHSQEDRERYREERREKDERREREEQRQREERRERERSERRERERSERRERERSERRDREDTQETKKPEIRKMPFIGKMPVYKHLGKNIKTEDKKDTQKKDDAKKQEEVIKKSQEIDAEIQKKVAEFKEKIAKAQLEKEQQMELQATHLALPQALPPPLLLAQPPPPVQGQATLAKDFQDALDIIFPSGPKSTEKLQQDIFNAMNSMNNSLLGPPPIGLPAFPHMGLMQPPQMFGFDINPGLFPQPQLYDAHVPIRPNKPRQQHNKQRQQQKNVKPVIQNKPNIVKPVQPPKDDKAQKKQEQIDDLAMLGIDASDVGAGM